ncbi:MAG TPA: lipocalin family protein [Fimbriimonadaceae bacterium]|nr:lipocalin family protein [Fimbriimonadaceae bacterium]
MALLALGLMVAGCGGLKDKLVGTWKVDVDSLQMPGLTPEMKKMPQVRDGFAKMHIELKGDGTYAATDIMGSTETGKWELNEKTLKVTPDKPEKGTEPTLTVSDDGSKIHAAGPGPTGGNLELDFVKSK